MVNQNLSVENQILRGESDFYSFLISYTGEVLEKDICIFNLRMEENKRIETEGIKKLLKYYALLALQ